MPPSTTTHLTGTKQVVSRGYLDGLGRPFLSDLNEGNNAYIVSQTVYDAAGRVVEAWKNYRDEAGYVSGMYQESEAIADYGNSFPYIETTYYADPLARVFQVEPEGHISTITIVYGVDPNIDAAYVQTTDEDSKVSKVYTDGFGNQVRTEAGIGSAEATVMEMDYDILGNLVTVRPPNYFDPPSGVANDWKTTYEYDVRSRLIGKNTPDTDAPFNYAYDAKGNLRAVEDPNHSQIGLSLLSRPLPSSATTMITRLQTAMVLLPCPASRELTPTSRRRTRMARRRASTPTSSATRCAPKPASVRRRQRLWRWTMTSSATSSRR